MSTAGARFRRALEAERPLQVVGAINALSALLAERAGFLALYLSGAGVANASLGRPDLGVTTLDDVRTDVRRITGTTNLPLLVDADTGWASTSGIDGTVRGLEEAGAAGLHLEDQVELKRCGHRPGKRLVDDEQMAARIASAVAARTDPSFVVMARTDACSVEGLDRAVERARRYVAAGADMIFAEAMAELDEYRRFADAVEAPLLANLTEFGKTPLFTLDQLRDAGVRLALYPLSAFRAMNRAADQVYQAIRTTGGQHDVLTAMQTRAELYDLLDYEASESRADAELDKEHQDQR
ncbi:MAG: methylisocitrate lyase [Phycisphaeraceae bacterium]|nr:methylisocitrate lyase [Phycisphaeraceae bacterium]